MTSIYTVDKLKLYANNHIVKQHFNENWNMTPDDVLSTVESYLSKQREYFREYYHKSNCDADVTSRINEQSKLVSKQQTTNRCVTTM